MKKTLFFLGKGGVGKTTLAGSLASYLAEKGHEVFLASIDPAHNLFDFFGVIPSRKQHNIEKRLTIEELDIEYHLKQFLRQTSEKMKDTYRYLQMINLENMFDVLKHSPGMEEYAILSALHELINVQKKKVDYIVIDTPPTGLMLKIFALPKATLMWIDRLKELRKRILERRSQIVHIKGKKAFPEGLPYRCDDDEIFKQLEFQYRLAEEVWQILKVSSKILVLNFDELSVKEGEKIVNALSSLDIKLDLAVFNKKGMSDISDSVLSKLFARMQDVKIIEIPFFRETLTLRDHIDEIAKRFEGHVL